MNNHANVLRKHNINYGLASAKERRAALELESYPKLTSKLFSESQHTKLRDFFDQHDHGHEQIDATVGFVKTMREYLNENQRDCLSLGHDDMGTISVISEPSHNDKAKSGAMNMVEIARFNPLELTGDQIDRIKADNSSVGDIIRDNIEIYDNIALSYIPEANQVQAPIRTAEGETIIFTLSGDGGASYTTRIEPSGQMTTSAIEGCQNLDYELEWDHPPLADKIRRDILARESAKRAFANL